MTSQRRIGWGRGWGREGGVGVDEKRSGIGGLALPKAAGGGCSSVGVDAEWRD